MPFLKKSTRLNAPWESDLKTLESLSASLICLLTYLKELKQNLSKRVQEVFQLHELFDELISYDFLLYPSTLKSSRPITSKIFFQKLEHFHFFPKSEDERNNLYIKYEVFDCAMINIYSKTRGEEMKKSEIHLLSSVMLT